MHADTPFTKLIKELMSDDEYRKLQIALILRPEQGTLTRKSGGLRKIRWAMKGTGKKGGIRLIYYWDKANETFYMLFIYPKTRVFLIKKFRK
ncbi:MAG: Toxin HigB-2 [bacterium ADurb.Bin363]|nr:MAG: Toxin HigB-2 [bacterium ADurb.Bin363]